MGKTFDIGDLVRVKVTFKDLDGTLVDPSAVALTVRDPSDNETTPAVTKESTGKYYSDVSIDEAGVWQYRWTGTGSAQAAVERSFNVRESVMDNP